MTGVNVGRTPINKGIKLTAAAKEALALASAHRKYPVYIYDDMYNLVSIYPSISIAAKVEKTQKNFIIKHLLSLSFPSFSLSPFAPREKKVMGTEQEQKGTL